MTLARKLITLFEETDTYVPSYVRRSVEKQERGEVSREGDPAKLLEALAMPRFDLHQRVKAVIASTPVV